MPLLAPSGAVTLADLVRLSAATGRAFRVQARGPYLTGAVYVDAGTVTYARVGESVGESALITLMSETDLQLVVEEAQARASRPMNVPWQQVAEVEAGLRYDRTGLHPLPRRRWAREIWARAWPVLAGAALVVVPAVAFWGAGRQSAETEILASGDGVGDLILEEGELVRPGDARPVLLTAEAPALPPDIQAPLGGGAAQGRSVTLRPTVPLRLRLGPDGRVAERQLFAPRPGFEAIERAALAAALRLVFVPARRLERPVSVWINFPLTFGDPSTEVDAEVALVRVEGSPLPARRLGPALGPAYRATRARPPLTWDGRGADVALAGLLDGSVTAAVTGRPATTEELTDARRRDVRLAELVIGHDGLAVVVHPDNPVRALTLAQLAALYRGEIARWPGVGGADRPVRLWATSLAAEDLGFFTERLGASGAPLRLASGASFVESPEQLLLAVAADRDAIGFASSALLARAAQPGASGRGGAAPERGASPAPSVRALRLAAADGELAFGPEALRTGRYPLRRPIFLYVRQAAPLAVTRLVDLLLSREGQRLVEAQGFTAAVDLPGRMGVALAAPGCPAPPPGTPPPAAAAPGALAAALPVAPSPSTPSLAAPRAAPRATPQAPSGAAMLTVRFGARDADLARTSRPTLERLARRLRRSDAAVLLVAPRDEDGRDGAARERAQRVAMFLRRRDVARERLQVRLGPPADDPRRVEVHVDPL